MLDKKAYQQHELTNFMNPKHAFHDSVKDFSGYLENMNILEQIEWIENGSYGAGACYALQDALNHCNKRTNTRARIGQVVLHAFYGARFLKWNKLSPDAQNKINEAVDVWLTQKHNFAETLID